jgi:Flp pilus assembly protein TadG
MTAVGKGSDAPMTRMRRHGADRGSAAVEFALLLPVLMLIIFGIIDFGRYMNARIVLSQAAYEGARAAAVTDSTDAATAAVNRIAGGLGGTLDTPQVSVCSEPPAPNETATVTLTFHLKFAFPAFGDGATITTTSVAPCL